jgi:hypothetical protein
MTATNQSRSTASDGYYRPIAQTRDNFNLLTRHEVTKINFDGNKRAKSVSVSVPWSTQGSIIGVDQLPSLYHAMRATHLRSTPLKRAGKSFWPREQLEVRKSCSSPALDPRSCSQGSESKRLSISRALDRTSKINRPCTCSTTVSEPRRSCQIAANIRCYCIGTVSNIPFPDPDWINTNETWASEQLAIYLSNRTGKLRKDPGYQL